jgi:hypothetical protein
MERTITKQCLNRSFLERFEVIDMEGTITKQALIAASSKLLIS